MDTRFDKIFEAREISSSQNNLSDSPTDLDVPILLAKSSVPYSHRRIAYNYNILKRVCDFQIVQPRISMFETSLLKKYSFSTLENSTISQINKEIALLKQWAISTNDDLRNDSIELLKIRVKELKFIQSHNYTIKSNEMYKGYKSIELYLTNITNYYE